MPNKEDLDERKSTLNLFLVLGGVALAMVLVMLFVVAPAMSEALSPGIGIDVAAIIAFGVTLVVIVVMMVAAGDGILGEIQYTLPAFFVFFLLIWLLVAWVF